MSIPPSGLSRRHLIAAGAFGLAWPLARSQSFPTKPIRLIVPYTAGGTTDVMARAAGEVMGKYLGQPIIIDNKPGANTLLGTRLAAAAEPDGHTILFGTEANLIFNPMMYKAPGYEPERDFAAIGLLADVPQIIAVRPELKINTLAELVAYAKKNPDVLNFGTSGLGGNGHMAAELFMQDFGVKMVSVPFNGGAPALTAALSGTVQVLFGTVSSAVPYFKSGKLVPLAVTTSRRISALPEIPTVAESGAPGFEASLHYGLVAPRKTPPAVLQRLNDALNEALANPGFRQAVERGGDFVYQPHAPEMYGQSTAQARTVWAKIIKAKNLSLD